MQILRLRKKELPLAQTNGCEKLGAKGLQKQKHLLNLQKHQNLLQRKERKMAKNKPHYLPSGKLFKGATHKTLMSGATHTKTSKNLSHSKPRKK